VEDGTVLTPALARMAKSAAVPRSTVRSGETAAAGTAGTGRNVYVIKSSDASVHPGGVARPKTLTMRCVVIGSDANILGIIFKK